MRRETADRGTRFTRGTRMAARGDDELALYDLGAHGDPRLADLATPSSAPRR
jgi:hypothetical protein